MRPTGLLLHVRRSKTDPDAAGQVVGVACGRHAETDPVAALRAWLARRGAAPGPLFTSMRAAELAHQHAAGEPEPLRGNGVARLLKRRALGAGLPGDRITGHSLRAGHATAAAAAGVSVDRIAAQTRHRRVDVLVERYIRPAQLLATTSSRDLGL